MIFLIANSNGTSSSEILILTQGGLLLSSRCRSLLKRVAGCDGTPEVSCRGRLVMVAKDSIQKVLSPSLPLFSNSSLTLYKLVS